MAFKYVRSGGTGGSWSGTVFASLELGFAAGSPGDVFVVSEDHAQSGTSPSLQSPATAAAPCAVICASHTGSVPPVSADLRTTATITASADTNMSIGTGSEYVYYSGLKFIVGAARIDMAGGTTMDGYFKSCTFKQTGTGRSNFVVVGNGGIGSFIAFDNTGFDVAGTDACVNVNQGHLLWKNTATPVVTTFPATLIKSNPGSAVLDGLDLSAAGFSGQYIAIWSNGADGSITVKNCKTHSGLLQVFGDPPHGAAFYLINTDSSGTNYRNEKKTYQGSQVPETTIVRTGGATDGATPISTKIVTTANANWMFPFEAMLQPVFNTSTAANVTVTVSGIWGGGAVPNNDDIWIEVSYMGSSGSPIATIDTSNGKADFLATNAAQATDSGSTWGGSTTKFKMAVTLSSPQPAQRGPIYVTVKAAAASSTFYIDPKAVLS